jgi:hypothetical protein
MRALSRSGRAGPPPDGGDLPRERLLRHRFPCWTDVQWWELGRRRLGRLEIELGLGCEGFGLGHERRGLGPKGLRLGRKGVEVGRKGVRVGREGLGLREREQRLGQALSV